MARLRSLHVEAALRRGGNAVSCEGPGVWRLALDCGARHSARARVADGWLDVRADIPHGGRTPHDDLSWLRFNAFLCGGVRAARPLGQRMPHVRAEVFLGEEGEEEDWVVDRVAPALAGLGEAIHRIERPAGESDRPVGPSALDARAVQQACSEAGWRCVVTENSGVRFPIETRAGTLVAGLETSPAGQERLVVDVMDVAGSTGTRPAQAALLMALGSSVRTVTPMLVERDGALHVQCATPVHGLLAVALDRALTALAAALHMSGRELQALHDERLARDYVALWEAAYSHTPHNTTEEEPCLQQR